MLVDEAPFPRHTITLPRFGHSFHVRHICDGYNHSEWGEWITMMVGLVWPFSCIEPPSPPDEGFKWLTILTATKMIPSEVFPQNIIFVSRFKMKDDGGEWNISETIRTIPLNRTKELQFFKQRKPFFHYFGFNCNGIFAILSFQVAPLNQVTKVSNFGVKREKRCRGCR